jgi:hypothetical protein
MTLRASLPPLARSTRLHAKCRSHDRTHVEFDLSVGASPSAEQRAVWETFIFAPASFRLEEYYPKDELYEDLHSYWQTVPTDSDEATDAFVSVLVRDLTSGHASAQTGTRVLASRARDRILVHLDPLRTGAAAPEHFERLHGELLRWRARIDRVLACPIHDENLGIYRAWMDEDVSLLIEDVAANFAHDLAIRGEEEPWQALRADYTRLALAEARHRLEAGYDSVGHAGLSERGLEHLVFRRQFLKRFNGSIDWLKAEVRAGASLSLQIVYALAAALAMVIALLAALGVPTNGDQALRYVLVGGIVYAVKDRLKANLQSLLARWLARRAPDRFWHVQTAAGRTLATIDERAAFLTFAQTPADVLEVRRQTRAHHLEESARPETVIHHRKVMTIAPLDEDPATLRASALREIVRLHIGEWLENTDDPKQRVVLADPTLGELVTAKARRVYNVNILYRLQPLADAPQWSRVRVVVARSGIVRVDAIGASDESAFLAVPSVHVDPVPSVRLDPDLD